MPQCFAEPENAFQIEIWCMFLDFLVNFWLFLLISSFLDLSTVFLSKISKCGNFSLLIYLLNASFYLDVILFHKIVLMLIRFWYFFLQFSSVLFVFVVIARNSFFLQYGDLIFFAIKIQSIFCVRFSKVF